MKIRSVILVVLLFAGSLCAQTTQPSILSRIGIDQKLGAQVPTNLVFTDETGKTVHLSDYLGRRPVILSLVYYQCPMLCTMSLNDLTRAMGAMPLNPGDDFEIVTVSFDPREGPDLALAKKKRYIHEYKKPKAAEAWHFLSGDETNIKKLTEAVGFRYAWDDKYNQYAHAAGFVVLTPSGTVSRYFYGVDYSSKDMRLALTEASEGKVSHPVEQFLLYCYHYDPSTGKYSLAVLRLLKIAGAITVLSLGTFLFVNFRRDWRVSRQAPEARSMDKGFQWWPDQASSFAPGVDALYLFLIAITVFFTVLIFAAIVFLSLKYRRRPGKKPQIVHTSKLLELTWTIIPFGICMVLFVWSAGLYVHMRRPPDDAMQINVVGKQWMWKIQHPTGKREIDELHLPLGRPIKLMLASEDVVHSFFIPAFRVKQDVVPGTYESEWFTPTKIGEYHLFCAEYCGTQHSGMVGKVIVMEPSEYQAWLAGTPADQSPVAAGEKLFTQYQCITCHGQRGPGLVGLYGSKVKLIDGSTITADEEYLRESILRPGAKIVAGFQPLMPTFANQLTEEQVMELIAYIKSFAHKAHHRNLPLK